MGELKNYLLLRKHCNSGPERPEIRTGVIKGRVKATCKTTRTSSCESQNVKKMVFQECAYSVG